MHNKHTDDSIDYAELDKLLEKKQIKILKNKYEYVRTELAVLKK